MKHKKTLNDYLNLPWTYTVETETYKGKTYFVIRVNELPGICTDDEDLNAGMENIKQAIACAIEIYMERGEPVPEPMDRTHYKGKILYRTDSERHFLIAKVAKSMHKSLSKALDTIVDNGLKSLAYR